MTVEQGRMAQEVGGDRSVSCGTALETRFGHSHRLVTVARQMNAHILCVFLQDLLKVGILVLTHNTFIPFCKFIDTSKILYSAIIIIMLRLYIYIYNIYICMYIYINRFYYTTVTNNETNVIRILPASSTFNNYNPDSAMTPQGGLCTLYERRYPGNRVELM